MSETPRFLLADDHPLFREALRWAIERLWPEARIDEADTLAAARRALGEAPADLAVLDLKLPDSDGFVGLVALRSEFPRTPVVVVSATEDAATVSHAIALGAQGFIPKSAGLPVLSNALQAVLTGEVWTPPDVVLHQPSAELRALATLTPAEARMLGCLRRGLLNKQIAFEFGISESTVKTQISAMLRKLGVVNRTQALLLAQGLALDPAGEP